MQADSATPFRNIARMDGVGLGNVGQAYWVRSWLKGEGASVPFIYWVLIPRRVGQGFFDQSVVDQSILNQGVM